MGWIILAIIVVLIIIVISMYNNLVRLRQKVKNAWSQIDVHLQRRFDLIPNLGLLGQMLLVFLRKLN